MIFGRRRVRALKELRLPVKAMIRSLDLAALREMGDVVLFDIAEGMPQGKALDILQSGPVEGYDVMVTGSNDYEPTAGSDIVIITAGFPRKPGMSRDDLLMANYEIVKKATEEAVRYSPNAFLILVTNPLDAMCWVAYQVSKFDRQRVMGMAGVLDTARYRTFLAMELGVSVESISALVLGGHGDTMVPLPRLTTVGGIPLPELLPKERIDAIVQRTRDGGAEIVKLLKTGSAYYAPSAAVIEMVESILLDKKKIIPSSVLLQGEYGLKDVFLGVPVVLGERGAEKIIELKLNKDELVQLHKAAELVRETVSKVQL